MKHGIEELKKLDSTIRKRKTLAETYDRILHDKRLPNPYVPKDFEHTFLKYPFLINNREAFFMEAQNANVEIGDWFLSPIHPIKNDFSRWNYTYGTAPIAEKISNNIVNLPTNLSGEKDVNRVIELIEKHV